MFREYVNLVEESVKEGIDKGIETFLENLNTDIEMDEIFENNNGIDGVIERIFIENGITPTPLQENSEEDFDKKLDNILVQLKEQGVID